uniref:Uncharacterized protein n=1 Tax=Lactuca sativa TaxID=4236 RepID=A0A9R1V414_LACSA|nr:hypothetical protein LSAT_V11C600312360 [Lactuca sativa]
MIRLHTKLGCLAMSRSLLLVTLLLLMVLTSQFDWNQKVVNEVETRSSALLRRQQLVLQREEYVKEKVRTSFLFFSCQISKSILGYNAVFILYSTSSLHI